MRLKDTKSLSLQMVRDQGGNVFLIIYYKDFHDRVSCWSGQGRSISCLVYLDRMIATFTWSRKRFRSAGAEIGFENRLDSVGTRC